MGNKNTKDDNGPFLYTMAIKGSVSIKDMGPNFQLYCKFIMGETYMISEIISHSVNLPNVKHVLNKVENFPEIIEGKHEALRILNNYKLELESLERTKTKNCIIT